MSKRNKNQGNERAIKAGSNEPKKPTDKAKTRTGEKKTKPLDQLCTEVGEIDFEGQIEFTEENLKNLMPGENGVKIFMCFELDGPDDIEDYAYLASPILKNKLAEKNNVHVLFTVPYLFKVPLAEIFTDARMEKDSVFIVGGDTGYIVAQETLEQYQKALKYIGHEDEKKQVTSSEEFKELVNNILAAQPRENGYYEDLMEYWYSGNMYHEKDVIWANIEELLDESKGESKEDDNGERRVKTRVIGNPPTFVANFDAVDKMHSPMDVTNVKNVKVKDYRRVLSDEEKFDAEYYGKNIEFLSTLTPNEEVWYLATEKAKEMDSPGFAVVCLHGKFYIPVETQINFHTCELEEYIELFNVATCYSNHHACIGIVLADVGNMQVFTGIRYSKGRHFDWKRRIEQEIETYRVGEPDFNPFSDPYDAPDSDDEDVP